MPNGIIIKINICNYSINARIILISSTLGIQQHTGATATIYRASKAAVNNVMVSVSEELKSDNITVVSFHPGWVRTDMGGVNATLSAKESAKELIKSFENLLFSVYAKVSNEIVDQKIIKTRKLIYVK